MRWVLIVACVLAAFPSDAPNALATTAATLIEATPFLFASVAASRLPRAAAWLAPLLGCGCGNGPAALSLPAAAATALRFGPALAAARFAAACAVSLAIARKRQSASAHCAHVNTTTLCAELEGLLPSAAVAAALAQLATHVQLERLPAYAQLSGGAVLGLAAPCALGAVAIAGTLAAQAPLACVAYACIAGIVDVRALSARQSAARCQHDPSTYALLAIALGCVAWRHGDALVRPGFTVALAGCALACATLAVVHRSRTHGSGRLAAIAMLAGAMVTVPPPAYLATETTLSGLFPSESLSFTGRLADDGKRASLVRYAMTCCRADAAPVVVRLAHRLPYARGAWVHARGVVEIASGNFVLVTERAELVAAPADPYVYR